MGRREAPYQHKVHHEAVVQRKRREFCPVARLVVSSQLLVTKRQLKKGTFYCPNAQQLRILAKQLVVEERIMEDCPLDPGDVVSFIPPGPRSARALATGYFLTYAGAEKSFAAVDRGFRQAHRRLDQIFVVPVKDVWWKCP